MPILKKFPVAAFSILLIGAVTLGGAGIIMRYSDVNPFASAFWRMALSAPVLWAGALMVKQRDEDRGRHTDFGKVLVYVGLYFAGDMGFLHLSLHYTTVANASTLGNLAPAFIAFFMWHFHHVRFARIYVIGMVMALVGAVVLVGPSVSLGGTRLLGDVMGLFAAMFYAGYQLMVKAARIHYSPWRLMAASTTITAVALLPFALAMPGHFWPASLHNWWPLITLALVAQIGGQSAIAYAVAHLPASLSSVSLLMHPLSAAIGAMFLFHEWLHPVQVLGGGALLLGIFLSTRGHRGH